MCVEACVSGASPSRPSPTSGGHRLSTATVATGETFADAAAEWLRYVEHDRKRRPSTLQDYRNVVRRDLLSEFGETPIEQITTDWVDSFRARLVAEGRLSDRTINKLLVTLHGIFKRAQRVYGLSGNPAAAVERQPVSRSGDFEVLSPAKWRRWLGPPRTSRTRRCS